MAFNTNMVAGATCFACDHVISYAIYLENLTSPSGPPSLLQFVAVNLPKARKI